MNLEVGSVYQVPGQTGYYFCLDPDGTCFFVNTNEKQCDRQFLFQGQSETRQLPADAKKSTSVPSYIQAIFQDLTMIAKNGLI